MSEQSGSSGGSGHIEVRISITPGQALEFVEKLAYDREFREAYERNPRGELEKVGISFAPESLVPERVEAPPAALLEGALEELREIHDRGGPEEFSFWGFSLAFFAWVGLSFRGLRSFRSFRSVPERPES